MEDFPVEGLTRQGNLVRVYKVEKTWNLRQNPHRLTVVRREGSTGDPPVRLGQRKVSSSFPLPLISLVS